MDNLREITYEPDNSLKKGYLLIFKDIFDEIIQNKWLIYQLFKRDFSAMYKQSLVGIFWAFILPVISVGTFIILRRSGVFETGDINVPYPIYAILGMAFWNLFSTGLIAGANSLVKAGEMVIKINFSKKSLVIASIAQSFVAFLIQFILAIILFIVYQIIPAKSIIFIPLAIIPLVLLTFGLGFLFALLNSLIRDIGNILPILMTFLMFLTPILYSKPSHGLLSRFSDFNPLYYLVALPRDIMLTGSLTNLKGFIISGILSAAIFIICLLAFHLTETRITERI